MAVVSEKRTSRQNQDVKNTIRSRKDTFTAFLHNRSSSYLQSQYFEVQKAAALAVKVPMKVLGRSLVASWAPAIHRQTKYFGRPFAA